MVDREAVMGLLAGRPQRREVRRPGGADGGVVRYQMRPRVLAFGDHFWIEDAAGARVFRVDGKALRPRHCLELETAHGDPLCRIETRGPHVRDTMTIERPDGSRLAVMHKALVPPLREWWKVDVQGGSALEVHGNIRGHEYAVESDGQTLAEVSNRSSRSRGTYGIDIAAAGDVVLLLAVSIALDAMAHPVAATAGATGRSR